MKLIDRYVLRETLVPFLLALAIFTFLMTVRPMLDQAQGLLAKGVDLRTIGFLFITLIPQGLGITIPMAFLAGLLMALGRLSADREAVALLACGVSPLRLLRSVLVLAVLAGLVDLYVMTSVIPNSNQAFREETLRVLVSRSEGDIKPGLFYAGFPGKVIYVRESARGGGWSGVFLADVSHPGRPVVTLADTGFLNIDRPHRQVEIVLPGESTRYTPGEEDGVYDTARAQDLRFSVLADTVFGDGRLPLQRGGPEMTIADLRRVEAEKRAAGISPHPEIIQRHQMFSFPVACLVFALLGLAFGLHTRKEGRLTGLMIGLVVVFLYYGIMEVTESLTKGGHFPAVWTRWVPNLVLGAAGIAAVWWRQRTTSREISFELPAWVQRLRARGRVLPVPAVRVIVRLPDVHLPRPRLLDLYVSTRYLSVLALAFLGLQGLYYISTFIDKSERLFKGQADAALILQYLYYATPQFIAYVVPLATLVAVLATIGGLTRSSEMVVMRACGVSLYRLTVPLVVFAALWSGGLFVLGDRVLAQANHTADRLDAQIRGATLPSPAVPQVSGPSWLADSRGRIYYYGSYDVEHRALENLSVFETAQRPFRLVAHTLAARATFAGGTWQAQKGWAQRFSSTDHMTRDAFATRTLDMIPASSFAGRMPQEADLMTFGQLKAHIAELGVSGFSQADSRVRLQERIAFPLVTVVMTLLGVPFGLSTGRRGALYGVGLAIFLGFSYWFLDTFFVAFGRADLLPPLLAAWGANLLFLSAAAYLTLTVRT